MASVLDTFKIVLGFDTKGVKNGAAAAQKSFKDTQSVVSKSAQGMATSITGVVKEFIGLFLVIRSIQDAVHFFGELNGSIAQLGLESKNLGESATELRTWQQFAQQFGGTADGITKSIAGINSTLQDLEYNGVVNEQYRGFQRLGVAIADAHGQARNYKDILEDTADALRKNGIDRPRGQALLQGLGLDQGSINAVLEAQQKGNNIIESMYRREHATASGTASGVAAALSLERSWNDLKNALTSSAAQILNVVSPLLQKSFTGLGGFVQKHQADVADGLKSLLNWVNNGGLDTVINGFTAAGQAAMDLAHFLHRWLGTPDAADAQTAVNANTANATGVKTDRNTGAFRMFKAAADMHAEANYEEAHGLPAGALYGLNSAGSIPTDVEAATKILKDLQLQEAKKSGTKRFDPQVNADAWTTAIAQYREIMQITPPSYGDGLRLQLPDLRRSAVSSNAPQASQNVQIDTINVTTSAKDASGIAAELPKALKRKGVVSQATSGVTP